MHQFKGFAVVLTGQLPQPACLHAFACMSMCRLTMMAGAPNNSQGLAAWPGCIEGAMAWHVAVCSNDLTPSACRSLGLRKGLTLSTIPTGPCGSSPHPQTSCS